MSERYAKLSHLPENLYMEGSPVIIAAGALLKDNQTGRVIAQLKLRKRDVNPAPFLSSLQKRNILIHRRSTNPANPCQFRDVQRPLLIRRIVPQKHAGQILNRNLRPPYPLSLCPCVRHSRPHAHSYHGQVVRF